MVSISDILKNINLKLVAQYSSYTVYLRRCPKDFKRPAFLLEHVKTTRTDVNKSTVEKTVYITITCFVEVDEYYRPDPEDLSELQEGVIDLFNDYILVGDRAINVQSSAGGKDSDSAFVDIQFNFFDDRSAVSHITPLMGSVRTKIDQEG